MKRLFILFALVALVTQECAYADLSGSECDILTQMQKDVSESSTQVYQAQDAIEVFESQIDEARGTTGLGIAMIVIPTFLTVLHHAGSGRSEFINTALKKITIVLAAATVVAGGRVIYIHASKISSLRSSLKAAKAELTRAALRYTDDYLKLKVAIAQCEGRK